MTRMARSHCLVYGLACCVLTSGCATSLLNTSALMDSENLPDVGSMFKSTAAEKRAVGQFVEALREENEPALLRVSSARFRQTAERSDDLFRDLKILKLPKSDVTVVEVQRVDENRREVIAKAESGGKFQFLLEREESDSMWMVDDVLVRQFLKGTRTTKSTSEVLDLLATLRDFLEVWETGEREQILDMTSPALTASLSPLPTGWLKSLTSRIASGYEKGMARRPEATMHDNSAIVKLPARNGHLVLSIVRADGQWWVDDVEAQNHREKHRPGSVKRQADAINAINGFLTAYVGNDKDALQVVTSKTFFDSSLKLADLSLISLPGSSDVPEHYDIRAFEDQLTFMIPFGKEIVRLDLTEQESASASPFRFLVRDVTLYEKSTQRQRSLASLFTAPTRASVFLKAMAERNELMLEQITTPDFAEGTWKRAQMVGLTSKLNLPQFYSEGMKWLDSRTIGDRTEVEFKTADGMIVLVRLQDLHGHLKVADVQYPNERGEVTSLKSQLELGLPLMEFATAWQEKDFAGVQRASSTDFNRLVWSHLHGLPARFANVSKLTEKPAEVRVSPERASVVCGTGGQKVTTTLILEQGFWVIDEIRMAEANGQMAGMKSLLRSEIAEQLMGGSYMARRSSNGHDQVARVAQPSAAPATQFPQTNSNTGINPAVFSRNVDESGRPVGNKNPFQLASQNQAAPATSSAPAPIPAPQQNRTNNPRPANAGTGSTSSGMTVFGPNADKVAAAFDNLLDESLPVPAAANQTDPQPNKNMMYFGPDKAKLKNAPAAKPQVESVTQPADRPISLK